MPSRRSVPKLTAGRTKRIAPQSTTLKKTPPIQKPRKLVVLDESDCEDDAVEASKEQEDKVVAEFDVYLLRCAAGSSVDRYAFEQEQPAKMDGCVGRLKRSVKHAEFTYKTKRTVDGIAYNKKAAMYDGVYGGESFTKYADLACETVGFFKNDCFYLLPIDDSYEIRRKLIRPAELDLIEQNKLADETLQFVSRQIPQVVRVRYARPETEWQKRRREQSVYYRAMLFDQDPWIDCEVEKKDVKLVYATEIERAENTTASPFKIPILTKKTIDNF
ncbi:Sin-like protein region [Aphelenchoides besseyi]|nr:Sin-like protein region [Aphelenchoides besseyi]KAI6193218.1 Sin-like protein region [Aphelenchoides besseyi]